MFPYIKSVQQGSLRLHDTTDFNAGISGLVNILPEMFSFNEYISIYPSSFFTFRDHKILGLWSLKSAEYAR